ncbi:MAG TPA: GNAT family N-acetyltransferase [Acidimicrobiales bacterium]|jgi:GNAT superfamily N-acetyltransferase|nr:GNAT family N-acetyltransferase [Acidimicrobiales bacterium]
MSALSAPEGAPDSSDPPGYPRELERDVESGGLRYHVRPIRPADAPQLVELHARLSPRSVYLRFFSPHPNLSDAELTRFTEVDYEDRLALVATVRGRLVAVARYDRPPGAPEAEVAFVVDDAYQHHGVGSELLDELADAARARGVTAFRAETLAENRGMLDVFHHAGFPVTSGIESGTVTLRFPIAPTPASAAARAARRRRAETAG